MDQEYQEYKERREEFIELVKPLMEFLRENFHPHVSIIVTPLDAEVVIGEIAYSEEVSF